MKALRLLVGVIVLYGMAVLFRYFSFWGLGAGVLLLVIIGLIIIVGAVISVIYENRDFIYDLIKRFIRRASLTPWWRIVDGFFRKHTPHFHRFTKKTLDLTTTAGLSLTFGSIISFVFLVLFFGIVVDTMRYSSLVEADVRIIYFLRTVISPEANTFFIAITSLGNLPAVLIALAVTSVLLLRYGKFRSIVYLIMSTCGGFVASTVLKWVFMRERPINLNLIHIPNSPGLPSTHAVLSICLYGFMTFLILRELRRGVAKTGVIILSLAVIILIGMSRVYLGLHYPSDVFAGWYLGLSLLAFVITMYEVEYRFHPPGWVMVRDVGMSRRGKLSYMLVVAVLLSSVLTWATTAADRVETVDSEYPVESLQQFLSTAKRYSENLVGGTMEPLSFIVIGTQEQLQDAFTQAGWHTADIPNFSNFMRLYSRIAKNTQYETAPMTPAFYDAQTNDLGFEDATGVYTSRQRHHTRYWDTGARLGTVPIWVATASLDQGVGLGSVIHLPTHHIDPNIDTEREHIFQALIKTSHVATYESINLVGYHEGRNAAGDHFTTDGKAYVLHLK